LGARRELRLAERLAAGHHEQHIVGHKAEHGFDVAGLARGHPSGDQIVNGALIVSHQLLLSSGNQLLIKNRFISISKVWPIR
jgi:hypothetical protein